MEQHDRLIPPPSNHTERLFWIGLSCAALVHAGMILGVTQSKPRYLGERGGSPDAINVDFIDPADLARAPPDASPPNPAAPLDATPSLPAASAAVPVPPSPASTPAVPKADDAPAQKEAAPSRVAEPADRPPLEDSEAARKPPPAREHTTPAAAPTGSTPPRADVPPASLPPPPAAKIEPPKAKTNPNLALQLDLPPNFVAPPGLSTATVRPPDITRSGENDEFGRRVIRALRQTMPSPRGEIGRVTVRILLSPSGNLMELQLVRPASDPILTRSIMFAVRQSSFPIPPKGATVSDRTFLVTYIYN